MPTYLTAFFLVFFGRIALAQPGPASSPRPKPIITQVANGVYVHTTYNTYQNAAIPANGLIISTTDGVVLVDTGWDTRTNTDNTRYLLRWVADSLHQPVRLCIVTHAHDDRVGGIGALRQAGIRVISTPETARLAAKQGYDAPEGILPPDTTFRVGQTRIRCYFPGAGHSPDNLVVWLPDQQILHGGCLIKSVAVFGMGNLADANLSEWSQSIRRVMRRFGRAKLVVPGHEAWGGTESLQHTRNLLRKYTAAPPPR